MFNTINMKVLERLPSELYILNTVDTTNINDNKNIYRDSVKSIVIINPNSLPSSRLKRKLDILIILIKNLYLYQDLYNRIRIIVTRIYRFAI